MASDVHFQCSSLRQFFFLRLFVIIWFLLFLQAKWLQVTFFFRFSSLFIVCIFFLAWIVLKFCKRFWPSFLCLLFYVFIEVCSLFAIPMRFYFRVYILTMLSVSERKNFGETHSLLLLSPHLFILFRVWLQFRLVFKCEQLSLSNDQDIVIFNEIQLENIYMFLKKKRRTFFTRWLNFCMITNFITISSQ